MSFVKFFQLLQTQDMSPLFLVTEKEWVRYFCLYVRESALVFLVHADEGAFRLEEAPVHLPRFDVCASERERGIPTTKEGRSTNPSLCSLLPDMTATKSYQLFLSETAKDIWPPTTFSPWTIAVVHEATIRRWNQEENEYLLHTMEDFSRHFRGFFFSVPFEHFCRNKQTIAMTLQDMWQNMTRHVHLFFQNYWEPQQLAFLEHMEMTDFFDNACAQLAALEAERMETRGTLLETIRTQTRLEREVFDMERDVADFTFDESVKCAKRKRVLLRDLDQLRLARKYVEELIWLMHMKNTCFLLYFFVLSLPVRQAVDEVRNLQKWQPSSCIS